MDLGWFEASLKVQDIARSLDFYQTLGFRAVDGGVDARCVTVQKADCRMTLFQGHIEETQMTFWQGDVEAIGRSLTAQGLTFEKSPSTDERGSGALIRDPDGHLIHFVSMPVHFVDSPEHAHAAPAYAPGKPFYPPSPPNPEDLDLGWFEISLPVKDVNRSLEFYRKLGFREIPDPEDRTATLQNGDCRIGLYQGYLDPDRIQLIFWQGDVETIFDGLKARGLSFERGLLQDDRGKGALLIDPDGHPLYFVNISGVARKEAV